MLVGAPALTGEVTVLSKRCVRKSWGRGERLILHSHAWASPQPSSEGVETSQDLFESVFVLQKEV